MGTHQHGFERLSLWQLLKRHGIEIPIIQRDYAQGRDGKERLRNLFLASLKKAVSGEPQELDFIYGDLKNGLFCPLDGQQRLTTLFLLHCYAARKDKNESSGCQEILKRFTYETRRSSGDFCKCLVVEDFDIDWKLKHISTNIRDCSWFFSSWEKDPTVSGMLTMLDEIHGVFAPVDNLWKTLVDENPPVISFNYIQLKDFGLSDDLYIKMNARGKSLTPFEDFKAVLEKKIEKEQWDAHRKIVDSFAIKADTMWTDLFWKKAGRARFDLAYLCFMANSLICSIALKKGSIPQDKDTAIQRLSKNADTISPDDFGLQDYECLYSWLDVYSNIECMDATDLGVPFFEAFNRGESIFASVTKGVETTYSQRVMFYAQTQFLLKNVKDHVAFSDWMRVVRNIVRNSTIDSAETVRGALALIAELSAGCEEIYGFLSKMPIVSQFAADQVGEEKNKAYIIVNQADSKRKIHEIEDSLFCHGRIMFALYCADWKAQSNLDLDLLEKTNNVFNTYFNNAWIADDIRASLLTIGNGKYYEYWSSFLYAVNCPKFCLLQDLMDLKNYSYNGNYRHYLKELVRLLINKTPAQIANEFVPETGMPNWKVRLIKDPGLMGYSHKKYIAVDDSKGVCYLIPESRIKNSEDGKSRLKEIR